MYLLVIINFRFCGFYCCKLINHHKVRKCLMLAKHSSNTVCNHCKYTNTSKVSIYPAWCRTKQTAWLLIPNNWQLTKCLDLLQQLTFNSSGNITSYHSHYHDYMQITHLQYRSRETCCYGRSKTLVTGHGNDTIHRRVME